MAMVRKIFRIIKLIPPSNFELVIALSTFSESKLLKGENRVRMMNLYRKSPTKLPADKSQLRDEWYALENQFESTLTGSIVSGKKLPMVKKMIPMIAAGMRYIHKFGLESKRKVLCIACQWVCSAFKISNYFQETNLTNLI